MIKNKVKCKIMQSVEPLLIIWKYRKCVHSSEYVVVEIKLTVCHSINPLSNDKMNNSWDHVKVMNIFHDRIEIMIISNVGQFSGDGERFHKCKIYDPTTEKAYAGTVSIFNSGIM